MNEAYEAAYAKYQTAFQIFDQARTAYQNRKIDDNAFIAAKKLFDAAQAEMDEAEKAANCIGHDPLCPCQDGDACHYREVAGSPAWPLPV